MVNMFRQTDYWKKPLYIFIPAILIGIMFSPAKVQAIDYEQGDWVEYTDFRHITSIAADFMR